MLVRAIHLSDNDPPHVTKAVGFTTELTVVDQGAGDDGHTSSAGSDRQPPPRVVRRLDYGIKAAMALLRYRSGKWMTLKMLTTGN